LAASLLKAATSSRTLAISSSRASRLAAAMGGLGLGLRGAEPVGATGGPAVVP
jgi:hypothetical protein